MAAEPIREMRLDVKPGLYALRYVSSVDVRTAPSASVRTLQASQGLVEVVSIPGTPPGELDAPGSAIVIVASAAGAVEITLTTRGGSQNLDARFSLDLLGAATSQRPASALGAMSAGATAPGTPAGSQGGLGLELVAHVSRRGNVSVDEEGWIAGPRAPSAIEALQVQARGCDVGLAAQFRNLETRAAWSAWLTPGSLIGVPQRACALTGLRFKLVGPDAGRFEIVGEALFLGSPKAVARGSEIEFVAPGELDPLIGLKLMLAERVVAAPAEKVSRVRVFR